MHSLRLLKTISSRKGEDKKQINTNQGRSPAQGHAAGGNRMMSSSCRSVGRWTNLQCLHEEVKSQNCLLLQWLTNTDRSMFSSLTRMAGEKGPSPVQLGFADWNQAYHTHWRGGRFLNWNLNFTGRLWIPKYVFIVINRNRRWRES